MLAFKYPTWIVSDELDYVNDYQNCYLCLQSGRCYILCYEREPNGDPFPLKKGEGWYFSESSKYEAIRMHKSHVKRLIKQHWLDNKERIDSCRKEVGLRIDIPIVETTEERIERHRRNPDGFLSKREEEEYIRDFGEYNMWELIGMSSPYPKSPLLSVGLT